MVSNMDKSQVVSFAPGSLVSQSNELIRGQIALSSLNEKRLFYSVLSAVNPLVPDLVGANEETIEEFYRQHPDETLFSFPIAEFIAHWQISSESIYEEIDKACSSLTGARLYRAIVDGKGRYTQRRMNAFEFAEYSDAHVAVRITPSFMPYLINLSERMMGYTNIPLQYAVGFRSGYSFKLLELLLQRADFGLLEMSIEDVREVFAVNDKYEKFYHLSKNVFDIAIKEIVAIEGETATVTYEPVKVGRKITAVRFFFEFPAYSKRKAANKYRNKSLSRESTPVSDEKKTVSKPVSDSAVACLSPRAREMIEIAEKLKKTANT